MGYITARSMKIQKADGTVELRGPGQPVPEAETWANPAIWVKRGYITPTDGELVEYSRKKLKPARPSTSEDAKRAVARVPMPKAPLPGTEEPAVELAGLPEDADTRTELLKMSRADLNEFAEDNGVADASSYSNKGALADAVLAIAGE